jgi:hypothetical protein
MKPEPLPALLLAFALLVPVSGFCQESALLSAPKVAAKPGQPDVLVGMKRSGRFLGGNVYERRTSARQSLVRPFGMSATTSYFKVQNDTRGINAPPYALFAVKGAGSSRNFKVAYFNARNRNITARVTRGREILNIAARSEALIRQRITPTRTLPAGSSAKFPLSANNRRASLSDKAQVVLRRR